MILSKSTAVRSFKAWLARALQLAAFALLARHLSPEDFASVKLLAVASMLSQAALWEAAWRVRFAQEDKALGHDGGADLVCVLLSAVLALYALWDGSPLAWMAAAVPAATRWSIPPASRQAADAYLLYAGARLFSVWLLTSLGLGVGAFAAALLLSPAACRLAFGASRPSAGEKPVSPSLFAWTSASSVALMMSHALPFLFVLMGAERSMAGLFGAKLALAIFFAQGFGEFEPYLARWVSGGRLEGDWRSAAAAASIFTLVVGACGLAFPGAILEAVFGAAFAGSPENLRALILGAAGYTAYQRIFFRGLPRRSPAAGAGVAGLTLGLQILLTALTFPRWGLAAAAWSYAAISIAGAALASAAAARGEC